MRCDLAGLLCTAGGTWQRLRADRRGVTAIEYGFIGMLVFLAIIGGVTSVGTSLKPVFATISTAL